MPGAPHDQRAPKNGGETPFDRNVSQVALFERSLIWSTHVEQLTYNDSRFGAAPSAAAGELATGRTSTMSVTLADVFAGAGGLTLGFTTLDFEPVFAVERDADFAATYAANFGAHVLVGDIEQLLSAGLPQRCVDVLVGGPPCQGFSNLAGNRKHDPRRALWRSYLRTLEQVDADVFVLENVPNFLTSEEGSSFVATARARGYVVEPETAAVLNAAHFGVPQARRRAVIVGSRIGRIALPSPGMIRRTVRDAFSTGCWEEDIAIQGQPRRFELGASPVCGPDLHLARRPTPLSRARYRVVPEGGNRFDLLRKRPDLTPACWVRKTSGGTDIFGRLWWDRPAVTIRTEFFKPEKGRYLHPSEHRPITHWEALRLQSFPDSFRWVGSKTRIAAQIGNAVPPLLGQAVARSIQGQFRRVRLQNRMAALRRRGAA